MPILIEFKWKPKKIFMTHFSPMKIWQILSNDYVFLKLNSYCILFGNINAFWI